MTSIYLHVMYRIQMVNAYLSYHQGNMLACAEFENDANRYASELQRREILK